MRRQVTNKTDLRNNRSSFRLKLAAPGSGKRRTSMAAISRRPEGRRRWPGGGDKLVRAVVHRAGNIRRFRKLVAKADGLASALQKSPGFG
jgi:hypothetical protein